MQRLFSFLLLILVSLTIVVTVCGQRERDTWSTASPSSFEVSGQVRLADTGLPAERIPIRLERFGGGVVDQIDTDSGGRFRFPGLPRGYYKVVVNAPGYRLSQQDADLQVVFRSFMVFELVREKRPEITSEVIDARAPANAREAYSRGNAAVAQHKTDDAISHFAKALLLYPEFYDAQLAIGIAYMDSRQWSKAETAFQRALALKPETASVKVRLGEVQWRQKKYEAAEKELLAGLKLDENLWQGYFTLARLYLDTNDVTKAGMATGRTLQLKPDFAQAHLLAGNILLQVNQPDRAFVEYQEYLRLDPKGEFANQTRELVQELSKSISGRKP